MVDNFGKNLRSVGNYHDVQNTNHRGYRKAFLKIYFNKKTIMKNAGAINFYQQTSTKKKETDLTKENMIHGRVYHF